MSQKKSNVIFNKNNDIDELIKDVNNNINYCYYTVKIFRDILPSSSNTTENDFFMNVTFGNDKKLNENDIYDCIKIVKDIFFKNETYNENKKIKYNNKMLDVLKYYKNKINDDDVDNATFKSFLGFSFFIERCVEEFPYNITIEYSKKLYVNLCVYCKNMNIKKENKLMKCAGCKTNKILYCSYECQKLHWKEHKKVCEKKHLHI